MNLNRHFGEQLEKYIEKKGIAINKQAKKIGVSYQAYTDFFKSKNPRIGTQEKILNGLGITLEELFDEESNDQLISMKEYNKLLQEKNELLEEVAKYRLEKIKTLEAQNIRADSPVLQASTLHK